MVSAGGGKGKPLMLFLHGFPELWFSWRKQMAEFKEDYEVCCSFLLLHMAISPKSRYSARYRLSHIPCMQVVAIDMRGYGESEKPVGKQHYVIPKLASDAAAIVKALGHDK